jgi:hypothetical protein
MGVKCIGAMFKIVIDLISLIINSITNPLGLVSGVLAGIQNAITTGGNSIMNQILSYVMDWVSGIFTPVIVVLMILTYEFLKTYLIFAVPACLYRGALDEAGKNTESEGVKILLVVLVCATILFGTIFLLSLDVGLWNSFINWGNQDVPIPDTQGTFSPSGGNGGGGGGGGGAG